MIVGRLSTVTGQKSMESEFLSKKCAFSNDLLFQTIFHDFLASYHVMSDLQNETFNIYTKF